MVIEEEIRAAHWSLKAFKALGPDGLHAKFFQRFWLVVGRSVSEEVLVIFRERKILEYMNSTNIVLIPKTQGPESIGSYHLISLCNLVYKIVSKILVGRIRPLLDQLISPYQIAFVPSRKGVDNVIVMQEIIHTMGRTKGKCGYIALKIDLEKTYDKLEWGFIRGMLIRYNFPDNLIEIIMSCISSISTSLLFNGGSLEPFKPSRGIR